MIFAPNSKTIYLLKSNFDSVSLANVMGFSDYVLYKHDCMLVVNPLNLSEPRQLLFKLWLSDNAR